mmetsp:Transcript_43223/g.104315  ORF Transcript_43223/g.104315 Transcript_43223/m.104315 type:complete len:202 (+) Transcript_43223:106-711(+)
MFYRIEHFGVFVNLSLSTQEYKNPLNLVQTQPTPGIFSNNGVTLESTFLKLAWVKGLTRYLMRIKFRKMSGKTTLPWLRSAMVISKKTTPTSMSLLSCKMVCLRLGSTQSSNLCFRNPKAPGRTPSSDFTASPQKITDDSVGIANTNTSGRAGKNIMVKMSEQNASSRRTGRHHATCSLGRPYLPYSSTTKPKQKACNALK